MKFPGFIGPSYQLSSLNVDCQRCVNLYPELDEIGTAKDQSVGALVGTPGLSAPLLTLPTSPYRGSYLANDGKNFYVVGGNVLYLVSTSYVATPVGTIGTSAGPVSMADNGIQLMIVDGVNGWWTTLGSASLTQVTSPNYLGPASQVKYEDGRFILNIPGTNQFFVSDQLAVTFSGAFDSKSTMPDPIIGIETLLRNVWLFGANTTEVWFDAGNPPPSTPFSLIQGAFIEVGLAAQFSLKKINNTLFLVGQDDTHGVATVYMVNGGFQPQRISTQAVEFVMQNLGDISGTTAWAYEQNGHNFYCLNFKNSSGVSVSSTTWCYDMSTGLWHERAYLSQGIYQRSLIEGHDVFNNVHIVGDYQSGNIYQLSQEIYTDNGNPISRQRTFPHMNAEMRRIFYNALQIDFQPGVGIDGIGQGVDPQAMLQFSDDGGHSWSNEKWGSMGKIGQGKKRLIFRRLGQARDKVFRLTITDPVKVVLIGAEFYGSAGSK